MTSIKSPRTLAPKARPAAVAARAPSPVPTPAETCVGVITAVTPTGLSVRSGSLHSTGQRAASCLLVPALGDTVVCLRVAPDEVWVLAVLQREEGVENVLHCAGPTRLEVSAGALSLRADELSLHSKHFALRADRADVVTDEAKVMGRQLRVVGTAVKLVGSLLSTVFDRVTHHSKSHLRTTEGLDRVHATHLECEAQQLLRLSGQHTLVNGEKLVKTRGGQIHFG